MPLANLPTSPVRTSDDRDDLVFIDDLKRLWGIRAGANLPVSVIDKLKYRAVEIYSETYKFRMVKPWLGDFKKGLSWKCFVAFYVDSNFKKNI